MNQPEFHLQCQVVQFLRSQYPDVLFNADCGGVRYGSGRQAMLRGKRMKEAGHRKAFPDLAIFAVRIGGFVFLHNEPGCIKSEEIPAGYGIYGALFIELKTEANKDLGIRRGKVTPEQREVIDELNKRGYKAVVCHGYDEAVGVIKEYLG